MRTLLGGKSKDFITAVDEKNIIVVKEIGPDDGYKEMDEIAENILELLKSEGGEGIHIAYGTIVNDIKEVSKSYKEAKLAWMLERFSLMTEMLLHTVRLESAD